MLARWMLSAIAVVCSLDSTASAAADPDRTRSLIAVLQSAAGVFDKACACQQLGEIGDKDAVPALAALLADSHLSAYARSGLERIPDPSAAEALRAAAATLKGDRLAGVVNSLGVLRDTQAVALLHSLAAKPESGVVEEALLALGRIASDEAIQVLRRALADGAEASRPVAAAACLVAAEKELAEGRMRAAALLYDAVRTAKVPAPCRAAAVRGAILARKSDGPALLIEQLRSDDRLVRDVAVMTIREIPSDPLAGALNAELEREAVPELQIQLLWALVDCHNPRSLSVVKTKTGHDDPRVRKTALEVLGQIGSTAEAGVFLKAIVDGRSPDETAVALNSLERMEGAAIDAQIVKALASATAGPRIQLIRLLDHRAATIATRELFKQAADPDVKVSVAALRALRSLADFGDLSALIALALSCKDDAVREAVENAVVHVCTRAGRAAQGSEIVLTELRQTAAPVMKISWMRILAGLGDAKAMPAILAATGDADESVAAQAIEQLGRWPDPSPVEGLLALVESDAAPVRRDRALGAAIRLATAAADEHQRPDEVILEWLRRAHQAVQTIAHRRLILSGLGRLKHIGSLRLLAPYLDDPELQNEAAVAIVQIAPDLRREAPPLLTEALEKIMATTKDPDLRKLLSLSLLPAATAGFAQDSAQSELTLDLLPNEAWWGGAVTLGTKMPYGVAPIDINLDGDNRGNQYAPLLVSSKGRYVWCEKAFRFAFKDKTLRVTSAGNTFRYGQAGQNLRDAYRHAAKCFFPTDGKLPDRALFATPQYNTWIELMYDQNQRDVLKYAHAIVDNGLPPGVLMIDDNWQEDYGKWTFHPGRFPDPKAMMNELHALGFKVMVWVCPFVSPDCDVYRALAKKRAFFMDQPGDPAMVTWWNGKSAMLDLSNPAAKTWFTGELTRLQTDYGVDGFKLDAGDTPFYNAQYLAHEKLDANEHARLFGEIGLAFPLNEYRATWKLAGRPLVQRLRDKSHSWADLEQLIPDMIAAGLMGYTFVCPDLIGGGEFTSFLDQATIDQDLIVRSAQVHALAPMMQFSVAPWRVLDAAHLAAVKQAVALRMRFTPRILELAQASAATGEPILRPLAYVFPGGGYENVKDQFLMGDDLLVAPMTTKGTARTVQIPPGKWNVDDGTQITGPIQATFAVPLGRLLYFERQEHP